MQFELFPWVYIVCYIKLKGMKRILLLLLFHGGMKKKTLITLLYETALRFHSMIRFFCFFSYLHETKKNSLHSLNEVNQGRKVCPTRD